MSAPSMKQCPRCGQVCDLAARFCAGCGRAFTTTAPPPNRGPYIIGGILGTLAGVGILFGIRANAPKPAVPVLTPRPAQSAARPVAPSAPVSPPAAYIPPSIKVQRTPAQPRPASTPQPDPGEALPPLPSLASPKEPTSTETVQVPTWPYSPPSGAAAAPKPATAPPGVRVIGAGSERPKPPQDKIAAEAYMRWHRTSEEQWQKAQIDLRLMRDPKQGIRYLEAFRRSLAATKPQVPLEMQGYDQAREAAITRQLERIENQFVRAVR